MNKPPKCSNSKCENDGVIMFQNKFYCIECYNKIQDYFERKHQEAMEEVFK